MFVSTEERLVSAAHTLANNGDDVSVEAAATAAGVSRATAYRSFAGLQQLVDAMLRARAVYHAQAIQARLQSRSDALEKLEEVVAYAVEIYQSDATLRDLTPRTGLSRNPIARPVAVAVVEPLIVEGQRDGSIRRDLDVGTIADWLLDAYLGGIEHRTMTESVAREMFRTFYAPSLRPQVTVNEDRRLRASVAEHLQSALDLLTDSR